MVKDGTWPMGLQFLHIFDHAETMAFQGSFPKSAKSFTNLVPPAIPNHTYKFGSNESVSWKQILHPDRQTTWKHNVSKYFGLGIKGHTNQRASRWQKHLGKESHLSYNMHASRTLQENEMFQTFQFFVPQKWRKISQPLALDWPSFQGSQRKNFTWA